MFVRIALALSMAVACGQSSGQWLLVAQDSSANRKAVPEPDRAIAFKKVGEKSLQLYLFEPKSDSTTSKQAAPRAAIVFFFGGGWSNGSPQQFYAQARHLADRGMVAACADYRVYTRDKALVVDCIADAQDAMLYLRDHASELNIDPKRIAAGGGSAGGHLAAAVATLPYRGDAKEVGEKIRPNALVLFNPALVLASVAEEEIEKSNALRVDSLQQRMGDQPEAVSPYHHLSKDLPPTLILHGKADVTVPYATVKAFEKKAQELGAHCTLVGYADQTHGFFNFNRGTEQYEATRDEMVRFLTKHGFITEPRG
jgi:acetyl esterase/lipase